MDTGVRRGLGVALVGLLTWALIALIAALLRGDDGMLPMPLETVLGLVALVGLLAVFAGLGRVAWLLLRRR